MPSLIGVPVQHVINGPNFAVKIETMSLFLEYPPRNPHKHARSDARTHARTEMRAPSPLCATRLRFGADGEESLKARRLVDSRQVLHTLPLHRRFTLGLKGAGRNWFGRAPGLCGGGGEVKALALCAAAALACRTFRTPCRMPCVVSRGVVLSVACDVSRCMLSAHVRSGLQSQYRLPKRVVGPISGNAAGVENGGEVCAACTAARTTVRRPRCSLVHYCH